MLTHKVIQLTFIRTDALPFSFTPGQFITFFLPNQEGKLLRRSYSLANNSPDPSPILEIAITYVEEGFASNYLFKLKLGDELLCIGPRGKFTICTTDSVTHYLLVATGTGVVPYRSMLPIIAQQLEKKDITVTLLLGVRYAYDLLYIDDFLSFHRKYTRFNFRAYLSREQLLPKGYGYTGYVQSAFETVSLNPLLDIVYLCGNPYMIDDSFKQLQQMGFSKEHIKYEKYFPANDSHTLNKAERMSKA